MTSNSFSSSAPPSTADGSSRMTSRALRDRALAISTICRCATLKLSSRASGSTLKPSRAIVSMLLLPRSPPVDEAEAVLRQAPEAQVLGHRQMRRQHHLLVDHRDAELEHALRATAARSLSPATTIVARIGLIGAGQDLHQRRLAGAVLADQPEHLAATDFEVDIVQRDDARKALADAAHRQDRLGNSRNLRVHRHSEDPASRSRAALILILSFYMIITVSVLVKRRQRPPKGHDMI